MNRRTLRLPYTLFWMIILSMGMPLLPGNYNGYCFITSHVAYAITEDEENNIAIYIKYGPGVVNIISTAITWDFFLNPIPKEGSGSGSVINKDGYILTNYHVIRGAETLEVTMNDGSKWPAKLVGSDPDTDLAVIKIDPPKDLLSVIPMGDSDGLRVGQKVLAIGNPFGLDRSLTTGIISSLGRKLRTEEGLIIDNVIQTDAAVNPGNSGGPLLASNGEMIGINTAIFSPTGGNIGIGFAIPVNTAKSVVKELIAKGYVAHAWIGVTIQNMVPEFAEILGLKAERGAMIIDVVAGGPAYKAGLIGGSRRVQIGNYILIVGGDLITGVDGLAVNTTDDLMKYLDRLPPGRKIKLTIMRGDKEKTVTLTLAAQP